MSQTKSVRVQFYARTAVVYEFPRTWRGRIASFLLDWAVDQSTGHRIELPDYTPETFTDRLNLEEMIARGEL